MIPIYVDALWLSMAFLSGLVARRFNLPPLIGFLATGFFLNYSGYTEGSLDEILDILSSVGITLLLFTIGLKIKVKSLAKKEIWVTSGVHMIITTLGISSVIFGLSALGIKFFANTTIETALIIGFALSFSSTVFIVKSLEGRGEFTSTHGRLAIGVLIVQDIFAVIFLTVSKNVMPSIWILALPVYLYVIRLVLGKLLSKSGHGELLTIFGFFAPFIAGALAFDLINVKYDLGALIIGLLLVDHPKSEELYDRMMSFKDFFLIGFFINIGLADKPTLNSLIVTGALLFVVLFKGYLFLKIFSRFNLRARTNFLASLHLTNYSEFGLIVGAVAVNNGMLSSEWLVIMALAMSFSFLTFSPVISKSYELFERFKRPLTKINGVTKNIEKPSGLTTGTKYVVVGIGSLGMPAFEYFNEIHPNEVVGVDYNMDKIKALREEGYNIIWGDTTDREFWEGTNWENVRLVVLAMSDFASNFNTLKQINKLKNREFRLGVISHYDDEKEQYEELKVDYIYDYKRSVGRDFAQHAIDSTEISSEEEEED
ncbi:MAG: cation:proton antiporter [Brumimicrobium sp.]|nr:cation:proton antiporter [Brumimicrobium sp.]